MTTTTLNRRNNALATYRAKWHMNIPAVRNARRILVEEFGYTESMLRLARTR